MWSLREVGRRGWAEKTWSLPSNVPNQQVTPFTGEGWRTKNVTLVETSRVETKSPTPCPITWGMINRKSGRCHTGSGMISEPVKMVQLHYRHKRWTAFTSFPRMTIINNNSKVYTQHVYIRVTYAHLPSRWSRTQIVYKVIFCVCEKIKRQSRISHQCDLGSTLKITGTIAQSWMWIQKNWTLAQLTPAGRVPRTRTLTLLNFSCFLWWGIKPFGPADLIVLWGSNGTSRKAPQMIIMIANIFKTFFFLRWNIF